MFKHSTSVLLILTALGACTPSAFRAAGGVALMTVGGQVSLDNSSGSAALGAVRNDLDDALDLDDNNVSPYLRFDVDFGSHRVSLSGFAFDEEGDGVLANDFGDITSGTAVRSKMDFLNIKAAYSYGLIDLEFVRVAPGIAVNTLLTDIEVSALNSFEQVESVVGVPMPFLQAEVGLGPVSAVFDVGAMDIDLNDADGTYWDLEGVLMVRPSDSVDIFAGYRYIDLDSDGTADARSFDADLALRGWIFGLGITF